MKVNTKKLFAVLMLCLFALFLKNNNVEAGNTIVLDPGHDSSHAGAHANGISEEVVNLKIAKYCAEELKNYEGVGNIYLTRNGEGCPFPGTTSVEDNKKRVDFAKSVSADIYVSIHTNSSKNATVKGACVYYPNNNYNPMAYQAGRRLANLILSHLIDLGLNNRGTLVRNSEDNTRYPDGSLADYYGVIKNSKLAGFAGIIIEHAFLTNQEDVTGYLSDESKLKLLGIADAKGIADYYGLKKKTAWDKDVSNAKVFAAVSTDQKDVAITVTGLSKAPAVLMAVWSDKDGQDDLKFYSLPKDASGNWTYKIPVSDFNTGGTYYVHIYGADNGNNVFACSTAYSIKQPTATGIAVKNIDYDKETFDVEVSGVKATPQIAYVSVAVWTKSDQSDIKWITAQRTSEGVYTAKVSFKDYNYVAGNYFIHAYGCDTNGISGLLKTLNKQFEFPTRYVIYEIDESEVSYTIKSFGLLFPENVYAVYAAIWSEENGQDDIEWCKLEENSGMYSLTDYMMSHFTSGKILVHVYAFMKNDTQIFVGNVGFGPEKDDTATEYNGVINSDKSVAFNGKQAKITVGENKLYTQTDTKIPISPDEISNNFKYKESFYGLKNNLDYYRKVRTALAAGSGNLYKSIYPFGALLNNNTTQDINVSGEYSIDIKLPKAYRNKEIVIYELEEDGIGLSLGNCYKMMTNDSEYVNIKTKWTGNFVMAADGVPAMMGDLNFDGKVDLSDVLILLKAALGINELTEAQFNISDMDSDNNIGLNDVMILLKASLGITG